MNNIIKISIGLTIAFVISVASGTDAKAAFQAGKIIDDAVFTNTSSMSPGSIQNFLNKEVPNCDTYGQKTSEWGGPDLNGDGKVQRWEWGKSKLNETKFTCLKDYKTPDGRSAAKLIHDISLKYQINPQVLLVLLQKEQGLVTDTWPTKAVEYKAATGYGCPDTAPCDAKYYGLENQLEWSAKMFRAILNNSSTWYTPYVLGNNYIQYSPDKSCGGSWVDIQNRSTQALYNYTPYQPNQATINAGWGTARCGAYGNRNFYLYFTKWFGNTTGIQVFGDIGRRYAKLDREKGPLGKPVTKEHCTPSGCFQKFENGFIVGNGKTGYWENMNHIRSRYSKLGYEHGKLGFPIKPEFKTIKGGVFQQFERGFIMGSSSTGFWESLGEIRKAYGRLGHEHGKLGLPVGPEFRTTKGGVFQKFEGGFIIGSGSTGFWESLGEIRKVYGKLDYEHGKLGLPTSGEKKINESGGYYQNFVGGYIYDVGDGKYTHKIGGKFPL